MIFGCWPRTYSCLTISARLLTRHVYAACRALPLRVPYLPGQYVLEPVPPSKAVLRGSTRPSRGALLASLALISPIYRTFGISYPGNNRTFVRFFSFPGGKYTLEGVQTRGKDSPPTDGKKRKEPDACPALSCSRRRSFNRRLRASAIIRSVRGPRCVMSKRARPSRGPRSSGPLVHRQGSTG